MLRNRITKCLFSLVALMTATLSFAQEKNITGVILDETDTGIPGAYVVVKGETRGAMTDDQGRFTISVSPSDVLVASFLGYLDEEDERNWNFTRYCMDAIGSHVGFLDAAGLCAV